MSEHTQEILVPGLGVVRSTRPLSADMIQRLRDDLSVAQNQKDFKLLVVDQGLEFIPAPGLVLTDEQRELMKRFHEEGLIWLVNTALLHPRGWALTIHLDNNGEPVGLSIQGDGLEPWAFAPGEQADILQRYEEAESRRERTITPLLPETKDSPEPFRTETLD